MKVRPAIWFLLIIFIATGCGVKGDPLPPLLPAPEPPDRIKVRVREGTVELYWKAPAVSPEKPEYVPAAQWEILRAPLPDPGEGPFFQILARSDKANYVDERAPLDAKLVYAVRGISAEGRRGELSRTAAAYNVDPPKARIHPMAKRGKGGWAEISWTASPAVGPEVGFNLYRSRRQGNFPGAPINPDPIKGFSYIDGMLEDDLVYYYEIRTVIEVKGFPPVEGSWAALTLIDDIPPDIPQGLTVIWTGEGVLLKWFSNTEPDLAGYIIGRRPAGGGDFMPIIIDPVKDSTYLDRTAMPNTGYDYAVKAVDNKEPPNQSEKWSEPQRVFTAP